MESITEVIRKAENEINNQLYYSASERMLKFLRENSNRFEQQVSLGASQPVLLAEDSKEYKLWCEIVTDVTTYAGTDEGINIIEKIENLFGLDNTDNFNELEKKAVTHLNSLKNTWE